VFFKTLLRDAVEGEGRDGAVQMRDGDAPGAVGAAPAGKVVAINPDQAFTHTSAFAFVEFRARSRRGNTTTGRAPEGELLPAGEYCPRIRNLEK